MDLAEAGALLRDQLGNYRSRSYEALTQLVGHPHTMEVTGPSGTTYQIEIEVFWDDSPENGNVRVLGSIDDGGLRPILPLCDDFIRAPDGRFIDE